MSELDADRRGRLVERLRGGGQAIVTTTDLAHVPDADLPDVERIAVGRRLGPAGGWRVRNRRVPRPASGAVAALVEGLAPASGLAALQRVWRRRWGR
jgi:hypothetical protein